MVDPIVFNFLSKLKKNNNREWFLDNKPTYTEAKKCFEEVVNQVILIISEIDPGIGTLTAKDCIFRINRDIRFSKDKSPYKTNFGASIGKGGRRGEWAGYYIHLEPDNSFIGGGYYMPSPEHLKKIRTEIFENLDEFLTIVENKNFTKHFPELYQNKLKTAPKGFPKDFEGVEWLKYKSYAVLESVENEQVQSKNYFKTVKESIETLYPFNQFINTALDLEQ